MAETKKYVQKIVLSDGSVRYFYDAEAPRKSELNDYLPKAGGTIDGDLDISGGLSVGDVEWIEQDADIDNVLVHSDDGDVAKRSTDKLLEDIGGVSYSIDTERGILSFQIGKTN